MKTYSLPKERLDPLITLFRDTLLNNILPFWINHAIDHENGGFFFGLDRDGTVICKDKYVWIHGRFTWMLSQLNNVVHQYGVQVNEEWIKIAKHGYDFLVANCFDTDGRMFFTLSEDGSPLRKRRYLFSECFTIIAFAGFGKAMNDEVIKQKALELFKFMLHYHTTPGLLEPKVNTETRPMKGLSMPMIITVTAQVLRDVVDDPICNEWIDNSIAEVKNYFMKEEFECVLETVGPNGEFYDTFEGRIVNPGHSIELAWFFMHEAKYRNDQELLAMGLKILDWSWKKGWDTEYGGLLYFVDCKGLPCVEYWHDMKFWWPHAEAIIATLLAFQLTGDKKYEEWFDLVNDWSHKHFPDKEFGEWFGYLHRDGTLSTRIKGNNWKGPFHIPRMYLYSWGLIEEMKKEQK